MEKLVEEPLVLSLRINENGEAFLCSLLAPYTHGLAFQNYERICERMETNSRVDASSIRLNL